MVTTKEYRETINKIKEGWERVDKDNFKHTERGLTISISELKTNRDYFVNKLAEIKSKNPISEEGLNGEVLQAVKEYNQIHYYDEITVLEKEVEQHNNQIKAFEEMEWLSH